MFAQRIGIIERDSPLRQATYAFEASTAEAVAEQIGRYAERFAVLIVNVSAYATFTTYGLPRHYALVTFEKQED